MIPLLDHGFVRLVDMMGCDLSVVRAARVSYDADWRTGTHTGSDTRLINYLWKNKHTSPFEAVTMTFEVKAPLFVMRQWHRHRTWSFNEVSARYSEVEDHVYVPDPSIVGSQSADNKQGRILQADRDRTAQTDVVREHHEATYALYKQLLKEGWPRELARTVLPVAMYSRMFATVNLLNLFRFLTLRNHEHAQYEIQVYAEAMLDLIRPHVPTCVAAFETA
jgi:thymidylate synthase (FAD)